MKLLFRYSKLGFVTTLRIDEPELEEFARDLHSSALCEVVRCQSAMPADLAWLRAPNGGWQIRLKGAPWEQEGMSKEALYLQSDSLLDDLVREQLPEHPLLHAGAVSDRSGNALVICGSSGAGKTSLVLSCVMRGCNWLSDELLCFRDADPLLAEGFRRNFNIKERSFHEFPETVGLSGVREFALNDSRRRIRFLNADSLRAGKFTPKARIRAIIVPRFSPDALHPQTSPLDGHALVQHLAPELRSAHAGTLAWLAEVTRSVPSLVLHYSNARVAADCLMNLLHCE